MAGYRFDPPWGFLPVEQYLIRKWDAASPLSLEEQRRTLIDAFLEEDTLGPEIYACRQEPDKVSRVPTQAEVDDILKPFRPPAIRKIAQCYNPGHCYSFIFLRTHYGARRDEEAKAVTNWLKDSDPGEHGVYPEDKWWKLLDDPEYFNLGQDWERVYKLLPELAVPSRDRVNETFEDMPFEDDVTYEDILAYDFMADQYQCYLVTGGIMVIFDEEFFQTNEAALVFRDAKGKPLRTSRVKSCDLVFVDVAANLHRNLDTSQFWTAGVVGDKYTWMYG